MVIRRAHMATYPARKHILEQAIRSIEPQVDEIHLVLNEYQEVPRFLARIRKLNTILPDEDYKDVGKFLPVAAADDRVFLVDDDLLYCRNYCDFVEEMASGIGLDHGVFGIHGSIFHAANVSSTRRRTLFRFNRPLLVSTYVDQLGTGTAFALGKNVASCEMMRSAMKFVDIRYAKWCFENGIDQIALARPFGMVRSLRHGGDTIYRSFTGTNPEHILTELKSFAGKSPKVGQRIGPRIRFFDLFRAA